MNTQVNMESLQVLPFADYKKALKKDKKFIKKAKAVLFILDHNFKDGKKNVGVILFKKAKEGKEAFKKAKKEWKIPVKNLASGACELADGANGSEWQIALKMGNAPAEKIQKKGKAIFKSILATQPVFKLADSTSEEENEMPELKQDFEQLKSKLAQVASIVNAIKQKDTSAFTLQNADFIQSFREDVQEWLEDYETTDDSAVQEELSAEVPKLRQQHTQLEKVAELLGKRVVLSTFNDKFKQMTQQVKAYQNS